MLSTRKKFLMTALAALTFSTFVTALPQPQYRNPNNPNNLSPTNTPPERKPKHPLKDTDPLPIPHKRPLTTIICPCLTYPDSMLTPFKWTRLPTSVINYYPIFTRDVVDIPLVTTVIDVPSGVSEVVVYGPTDFDPAPVINVSRTEDISAALARWESTHVKPGVWISIPDAPTPAPAPAAVTPWAAAVATPAPIDPQIFVRGNDLRTITRTSTLSQTELVAKAEATEASGFDSVESASGDGDGDVVASADNDQAVVATVIITEVVSSSSDRVVTATEVVTEVVSSSVDETSPLSAEAATEVVTEVASSSTKSIRTRSTTITNVGSTTVTSTEVEEKTEEAPAAVVVVTPTSTIWRSVTVTATATVLPATTTFVTSNRPSSEEEEGQPLSLGTPIGTTVVVENGASFTDTLYSDMVTTKTNSFTVTAYTTTTVLGPPGNGPLVAVWRNSTFLQDAREGCIECQDIFEDKGEIPPEEWPPKNLTDYPPEMWNSPNVGERSVEEGVVGKLVPSVGARGEEFVEGEENDIDPAGLTVDVDEEQMKGNVSPRNDIDPAGLTVEVGESQVKKVAARNDIDPAGLTVEVGEEQIKGKEKVPLHHISHPSLNPTELKDPSPSIPPTFNNEAIKEELRDAGYFFPSQEITLTEAEKMQADAKAEGKGKGKGKVNARQLVPPEVTDPDLNILAGPGPVLPSNITLVTNNHDHNHNHNHTTRDIRSTNRETHTAENPEISFPPDFKPPKTLIPVPTYDFDRNHLTNLTHKTGTNSASSSSSSKPTTHTSRAHRRPHRRVRPKVLAPLAAAAPTPVTESKSKTESKALPDDFVFGETLLPLDKKAFTRMFNQHMNITDPEKSPLVQDEFLVGAGAGSVGGGAAVAGTANVARSARFRPIGPYQDPEATAEFRRAQEQAYYDNLKHQQKTPDITNNEQSAASAFPLINRNTHLSGVCNCAHNDDAHRWHDTMSPMDRATEICVAGGGCKITREKEEMCVMVGGGPNPCACLAGAIGEWQSYHRDVWWLWSAVHCGGSAVVVTDR